jgi:FkbM family methyltransferase
MTAARTIQRPVLGLRKLRRRGSVARVRRGGAQWELDLGEGIDFAIWLRGYFEPSTVKAYRELVRPGSTVIDIGANVGAHTLHLARSVGPTGRVIAFEPSAGAFARLARNTAINPDLEPRISLHQTMLLASPTAPLPPSVVSSWPLLPRAQLDPVHPGLATSTVGANATTLDDAMQALDIVDVDFIKLDVDGFELDVLQGAEGVLSKSIPPILCELAPSVLDGLGRRVEDVVDLLITHEYRLSAIGSDREVSSGDIAELRRTRASMNIVALPKQQRAMTVV